MASILKITTTIDVQSDILGKDAGEIVKGLVGDIRPIIRKAVNEWASPEPKKEEKN